MIKILKTSSEHKDFKILVEELDTYLSITDGEEHARAYLRRRQYR